MNRLFIFITTLILLSFGCLLADTTEKIEREGKATFAPIEQAKLPPGTDPNLFAGQISGDTFTLFLYDLPKQQVTIEMGFVDTQSTEADQRTFQLAANGFPLEANLDVWSKAGETNKPWIFKAPYNHPGGALTLLFNTLTGNAFVSYVQILDSTGKVIASGDSTRGFDSLHPLQL